MIVVGGQETCDRTACRDRSILAIHLSYGTRRSRSCCIYRRIVYTRSDEATLSGSACWAYTAVELFTFVAAPGERPGYTKLITDGNDLVLVHLDERCFYP